MVDALSCALLRRLTKKEVRIFRGRETMIKKSWNNMTKLKKERTIFTIVVARKIAYYVSFWFVGRPNSQNEFQADDRSRFKARRGGGTPQ